MSSPTSAQLDMTLIVLFDLAGGSAPGRRHGPAHPRRRAAGPRCGGARDRPPGQRPGTVNQQYRAGEGWLGELLDAAALRQRRRCVACCRRCGSGERRRSCPRLQARRPAPRVLMPRRMAGVLRWHQLQPQPRAIGCACHGCISAGRFNARRYINACTAGAKFAASSADRAVPYMTARGFIVIRSGFLCPTAVMNGNASGGLCN